MRHPTPTWDSRDIDLVLGLLPELQAPDFEPYIGPDLVLHPVLTRLWDFLYQSSAYIDGYAALPEDPTPDGIPFSVMGASFPASYFRSATLNQVRRYLVLCTRGERFCDGYIGGQLRSGAMLAAFERLRDLRKP